jgi:imidazolonepropionase-like amidohydrolase
MRIADRLGTIETGKLADLLVVEGDPLDDLAALRKLDLVLRNGEVVAGRLMGVDSR